jgi:hypothetical protein
MIDHTNHAADTTDTTDSTDTTPYNMQYLLMRAYLAWHEYHYTYRAGNLYAPLLLCTNGQKYRVIDASLLDIHEYPSVVVARHHGPATDGTRVFVMPLQAHFNRMSARFVWNPQRNPSHSMELWAPEVDRNVEHTILMNQALPLIMWFRQQQVKNKVPQENLRDIRKDIYGFLCDLNQ